MTQALPDDQVKIGKIILQLKRAKQITNLKTAREEGN